MNIFVILKQIVDGPNHILREEGRVVVPPPDLFPRPGDLGEEKKEEVQRPDGLLPKMIAVRWLDE